MIIYKGKRMEMKKYLIQVGTMSKSGAGDLNIEFMTDDLDEAKKEFERIVNFEKRTIRDWHLKNGEYLIISLEEKGNDGCSIDYVELR